MAGSGATCSAYRQRLIDTDQPKRCRSVPSSTCALRDAEVSVHELPDSSYNRSPSVPPKLLHADNSLHLLAEAASQQIVDSNRLLGQDGSEIAPSSGPYPSAHSATKEESSKEGTIASSTSSQAQASSSGDTQSPRLPPASPYLYRELEKTRCEKCGETFTKAHLYRQHVMTHIYAQSTSKRYDYRCAVCGETFRSRSAMAKHYESTGHHSSSAAAASGKDDASTASAQQYLKRAAALSDQGSGSADGDGMGRRFVCPYCQNAKFRIQGHLAKHLRSKAHITHLESLGILEAKTFELVSDAGRLGDIDTSDCATAIESIKQMQSELQSTADGSCNILTGCQVPSARKGSVEVAVTDNDTNDASTLRLIGGVSGPDLQPVTPPLNVETLDGSDEEEEDSPCKSPQPSNQPFLHTKLSTGETPQQAQLVESAVVASHAALLSSSEVTYVSATTSRGDDTPSKLHSVIAADLWIPPATTLFHRRSSASSAHQPAESVTGAAASSSCTATEKSTRRSSSSPDKSVSPRDMSAEGRQETDGSRGPTKRPSTEPGPTEEACDNMIELSASLPQAQSLPSGSVADPTASDTLPIAPGVKDELHKCCFCNANYENRIELSIHLHADHVLFRDGNDFKCPCDDCEQVYPSRHNLRSHIARHFYDGDMVLLAAAKGGTNGDKPAASSRPLGSSSSLSANDAGSPSVSSGPPSVNGSYAGLACDIAILRKSYCHDKGSTPTTSKTTFFPSSRESLGQHLGLSPYINDVATRTRPLSRPGDHQVVFKRLSGAPEGVQSMIDHLEHPGEDSGGRLANGLRPPASRISQSTDSPGSDMSDGSTNSGLTASAAGNALSPENPSPSVSAGSLACSTANGDISKTNNVLYQFQKNLSFTACDSRKLFPPSTKRIHPEDAVEETPQKCRRQNDCSDVAGSFRPHHRFGATSAEMIRASSSDFRASTPGRPPSGSTLRHKLSSRQSLPGSYVDMVDISTNSTAQPKLPGEELHPQLAVPCNPLLSANPHPLDTAALGAALDSRSSASLLATYPPFQQSAAALFPLAFASGGYGCQQAVVGNDQSSAAALAAALQQMQHQQTALSYAAGPSNAALAANSLHENSLLEALYRRSALAAPHAGGGHQATLLSSQSPSLTTGARNPSLAPAMAAPPPGGGGANNVLALAAAAAAAAASNQLTPAGAVAAAMAASLQLQTAAMAAAASGLIHPPPSNQQSHHLLLPHLQQSSSLVAPPGPRHPGAGISNSVTTASATPAEAEVSRFALAAAHAPSDAGVLCPLCQKSYPSAALLQEHMHAHSIPRPYICDQCDAGFTSADALRNHTVVYHRQSVVSTTMM